MNTFSFFNKFFAAAILCAAAVFVAEGCTKHGPDQGGGSGNGTDSATYTKLSTVGLSGLSGLCMTPDSSLLYAVCDGGILYKLNLDGTTNSKVYEGTNDFEAVTVNPSTGDIYLADEGTMTVWHLNSGLLEKVVTISIPNAVSNKGLEGLTYGNGNLYIANQASPTKIFVYNLTSKTITKEVTITFAGYLSDLCYDQKDGSIWIMDSEKQSIYHCSADLNLLKTYSVAFITKGEALSVDYNNKCYWVGSDANSSIWKIPFAYFN